MVRRCVFSESNEIRSGRRSHKQFLNAVFLIAEHKRSAVQDAVWTPLQQEYSPALAHSSRANFPADIHLVPTLGMFIETLKMRIKKWLLKH